MFDSDDTTTVRNFDNDEDKTIFLNSEQRQKYFTDLGKAIRNFRKEPDNRISPEERSK